MPIEASKLQTLQTQDEAIIAYLEKYSPLDPKIEGRIQNGTAVPGGNTTSPGPGGPGGPGDVDGGDGGDPDSAGQVLRWTASGLLITMAAVFGLMM